MTASPTAYQVALLDEHERISALLASFSVVREAPTAQLRNQLAELGTSDLVSSDPTVRDLYSELSGIVDAKIGKPLEGGEARKLREIAEEIRLRMVAVSLVGGLGIEELADLLIVDSHNPDPWQGALVHGMGGLSYASMKGYTVILFSSISSVAQCHDILAELSNIYDKTFLSNHWIFDFSAVAELPVLLLGSLLSYQRQLESVDKDLLLCWARPAMFPAESLERLTKLFRLTEVGGHLFSRPRNGAATTL